MLLDMGRRPRDEDPVASRLLEIRTERGISRGDLAEAVGVHYQTIGYLERGEYSPSLALALRICAVLGVAVEDCFSLERRDEGASRT
jgi:DNA-binding XRE family transcriptional regulator